MDSESVTKFIFMTDPTSTRRHFLKGLGLVTGAFATGAFASSVPQANAYDGYNNSSSAPSSSSSSSSSSSNSSSSSSSSSIGCHGAKLTGNALPTADPKIFYMAVTHIKCWASGQILKDEDVNFFIKAGGEQIGAVAINLQFYDNAKDGMTALGKIEKTLIGNMKKQCSSCK